MTRRLHFLLILVFAWIGWASVDDSLARKQWAWAQEPSRSSRSDGGSRDDRRDRYRGRSFGGDRGSRDRGGRSRGDEERRSEDRSGGSAASTNSSAASGSSRSTTPSTSSATTTAAKPATDSAAPSMNMTDYARSLVKKYDKNGDMMLQPDEQKELHGRAAEADLNHDGVITTTELVMHLSDTTPAATSSTPTSGGSSTAGSDSSGDGGRSSSFGSRRREGDSNNGDRSKADADKALAGRVFTGTAGGNGGTSKEGDNRHSYRFTRATDKLPSGLPGWFRSRDANGDGQVSMSEYSQSWSASSVAEFRRFDLNDDGIVTAKEVSKQK